MKIILAFLLLIISTGVNAAEGTVKWKINLLNQVASSPVFGADGTIYVTTPNTLYAINPDGTVKWTLLYAGSNSSPAIGADGTIYTTGLGYNGVHRNTIYATNPDGTQKWTYKFEYNYLAGLIVGSDGTIYTKGGVSILYALNPNGTEKWIMGTDFAGGVHPQLLASPDGTIYLRGRSSSGSDYVISAINPDNGIEKWRLDSLGNILNSPVIGADNTIYMGSDNHNLYAINSDGTQKWSFNAGDIVAGNSPPVIHIDGNIYVFSGRSLIVMNPNGVEQWRTETIPPILSFVIGNDGFMYVPNYDFSATPSKPVLYGLNTDGTEKWRSYSFFGGLWSPAIGPDGIIYIGSSDNHLYAINPSVEETYPSGPTPYATFSITPEAGEIPLVATLDAKWSIDGDGFITQYDWTISDGRTMTGEWTTVLFEQPGIYAITLKVTDNDGLTKQTFKQIVVDEALNINQDVTASFMRHIKGSSVTLNAATSTSKNGSIISYKWAASDGQTATGVTTSFNFDAIGDYVVTLVVIDNLGNQHSTSKTVSINSVSSAEPTASFSVNIQDMTALLDAYSSFTPNSQTNTYYWETLMGNKTGVDTSVLFNENGLYDINLDIVREDLKGTSAILSKNANIMILHKPEEAYSVNINKNYNLTPIIMYLLD